MYGLEYDALARQLSLDARRQTIAYRAEWDALRRIDRLQAALKTAIARLGAPAEVRRGLPPMGDERFSTPQAR